MLAQEQRKLIEEACWSHHLHKCSKAIFPGLVGVAKDPKLRDDKQEVIALLELQGGANLDDEGLDEFEDHSVLILETRSQQVAHVDDYPLLRRQIVLEVCLAASCPLYLFAQR